jgi:hypothetical protein
LSFFRSVLAQRGITSQKQSNPSSCLKNGSLSGARPRRSPRTWDPGPPHPLPTTDRGGFHLGDRRTRTKEIDRNEEGLDRPLDQDAAARKARRLNDSAYKEVATAHYINAQPEYEELVAAGYRDG